jgi:hypothetical protein
MSTNFKASKASKALVKLVTRFTWQLARKSMSTNFKASKASKALVKLVTRFTWQLARKSMSTNFKDKVFKELFEQVLRLLALLVQKY